MVKISYGGRIIGDYDEAQISSLMVAGVIDDSALYWRQGMTDWKPIGELAVQVPGLPPTGQAPPLPQYEEPGGKVAKGCFWFWLKVNMWAIVFMLVVLTIFLLISLLSKFVS